jgi:ribosomal protein RSM22 (predicted rRNA methylase)
VPFRLSYHDLAARATGDVPRDKLARAVERLSAAYREGRAVDTHATREGRAAYLVHTLGAHACDVRRLVLDALEAEIARDLRVVALGAGPGTEALALAEAWATLSARDGKPPGRTLHVDRVDRVAAWEESFVALRAAFEPMLRELDPGLGQAWTWETPPLVSCDLARPLPEALLELVAQADLVVAANLLSEILPRGTPDLPPVLVENLEAIAGRAREGAAFVVLDRGHAPGVMARIEAAARALGETRVEVHEREVRCACALTKTTKALYAKVKLPTTKVEDRPIGNTRTAWTLVRFRGR